MAVSTNGMLTREQAAEFLGVSPGTLAHWACSGRFGLRYFRVGRSVRYRQSDLEAWLEKRSATSAADLQGD